LLARQLLTCLPLADCRLPPPARSKNPNPWSGLSFHPAEAAVYFTSALPVLLLPYPYWVFRVHLLGLMLTPANGHQGHAQGGSDVLGVRHHYVHHVQFNCNFGSPTPLWDTLCGTGARAVSAADAPAKQE
jgi:sterol desaturase/sphingolipid hydroxylase (fatty acid hydroxylase superfamily)